MVSPGQLPEGEEDGEFAVELLELVKSAKNKLGLALSLSQEPHHIGLEGETEHENTERKLPFPLLLEFSISCSKIRDES